MRLIAWCLHICPSPGVVRHHSVLGNLLLGHPSQVLSMYPCIQLFHRPMSPEQCRRLIV